MPNLDLRDPIRLLEELVRIDSRTPGELDRPVPAGAATEAALAAALGEALAAAGFATELQEAAPGRPNLLAWLGEVKPERPTLLFEAHLDTVGTEGMTGPALAPEIRDGRLYGRGACDTKGSLAAMLCALVRLRTERLPLNLAFLGACAEETGCEGVQRAELGRLGRELHIVVGEPTQNRPVAGHKTHIWFELETRGRAAHGSVPEQGENAIYRMAAVLRELQGYAAGPLRGLAPCPAGFTPPTLSVGVIRGGVKENIVPDRCAIQVDGRLLPAQAPDSFLPALVAELGRRAGYELRVNWSRLARGMQTPAGSRLLPALLAAAGAVTGRPVAAGIVNYCTDGGHLAHLGHDTVVFGPGDIGQAHSAVEWLELGQLREAVEILVAAARGLAGRGGAGE